MSIKLKLLTFLVLLSLLVIASGSLPALAQDTVSISVSPTSTSIVSGGTFNVSININAGSTQVQGWQGDVEYDAAKLTYKSVVAGDFFDGFGETVLATNATVDNTAGRIHNLAYIGATQNSGGKSGSGTLCKLTFQANSGVTGSASITPVNFVIADANIQTVIPDSSNGSINISAPSSGGGGGGGPAPTYSISVSGLTPSAISRNSGGKTLQVSKIKTLDGMAELNIAQGTTFSSNPSFRLTGVAMSAPPAAPEGNMVITAYTFGPDGAKFEPAIGLALSYDPANLPAGVTENDLYAAYFDGTAWTKLADSAVDPASKTVTTRISHFSSYGLLGTITPPAATVEPVPSTSPTPEPSPTPAPPEVGPSPAPTAVPTETVSTASPTPVLTAATTVPTTTSPAPRAGANHAVFGHCYVRLSRRFQP